MCYTAYDSILIVNKQMSQIVNLQIKMGGDQARDYPIITNTNEKPLKCACRYRNPSRSRLLNVSRTQTLAWNNRHIHLVTDMQVIDHIDTHDVVDMVAMHTQDDVYVCMMSSLGVVTVAGVYGNVIVRVIMNFNGTDDYELMKRAAGIVAVDDKSAFVYDVDGNYAKISIKV